MESYVTIAKRIDQAREVKQHAQSAENRFLGEKLHVQNLLGIQAEWHQDETVGAQDVSTIDAIFVTYRPQIAAILALIDEGIAAAQENSSEGNE